MGGIKLASPIQLLYIGELRVVVSTIDDGDVEMKQTPITFTASRCYIIVGYCVVLA